eukprot:scaffold324_cov326-Pavlova_lutheri.AAC.13
MGREKIKWTAPGPRTTAWLPVWTRRLAGGPASCGIRPENKRQSMRSRGRRSASPHPTTRSIL